MTFTDDDLKRLKEDGAKYGYQLCKPDGLILDLAAFLARLEAAEGSLKSHTFGGPCPCDYCIAWRTVAGRSGK